MTPDKYRRGAIGVAIRYTTSPSPLGRLLIAATERGVCAIRFGDSDSDLELVSAASTPSPHANVRMTIYSRGINKSCNTSKAISSCHTPLDIQATAFQRKVWSYLQTIPAELPSLQPGRPRIDAPPPPAP